MEFELRGAREEDIDVLFQIHKDAYEENVSKIWGWDDEWQSDIFRKSIVLENVQVIEVQGTPIGYVSVDRKEDLIFMQSIAITSSHRSKGIGTKMIEAIIEESEASGIPVHLQVMKINRARGLYERLGFKIYGDTENHFKFKR